MSSFGKLSKTSGKRASGFFAINGCRQLILPEPHDIKKCKWTIHILAHIFLIKDSTLNVNGVVLAVPENLDLFL